MCWMHQSFITYFFHFTIFWSCSAAQTCTVTTQTIKSLNIEAGNCKADKENEQSTADVTIHAVSDPNTKGVDERTDCTFQCQLGYFNETVGDKIPFKCVPNPDKTDPLGIKQPAPAGCKGVCVICVLTFSITIVFGAG